MSTTLEPPRPAPEARDHPIDIHAFEHHWQDEADAAYLYRILADAEQDAKKKEIYARLASVEDRHVTIWTELLAKHGRPPGTFKPSGGPPLPSPLGKVSGPIFLRPMLPGKKGRGEK